LRRHGGRLDAATVISVLCSQCCGKFGGGVQSELRGQTAATAATEQVGGITVDTCAGRWRDGVTLRGNVYVPRADGNFLLMLERTPYDKSGGARFRHRVAAGTRVCCGDKTLAGGTPAKASGILIQKRIERERLGLRGSGRLRSFRDADGKSGNAGGHTLASTQFAGGDRASVRFSFSGHLRSECTALIYHALVSTKAERLSSGQINVGFGIERRYFAARSDRHHNSRSEEDASLTELCDALRTAAKSLAPD